MSHEMVDYFRNAFQNIEFPIETEITPTSRTSFYRAMDISLMYRGHPNVLSRSMEEFLKSNCRPFAYAGAAKVLMLSSYISSREYDDYGLQASREWLSIARQDVTRCFEIELIHGEIEQASNKLDNIKSNLDELNTFDEAKDSYYVALLNMFYHSKRKQRGEEQKWEDIAERLAENDYQKLFVINGKAGNFIQDKKWSDAAKHYEQVIAIDKQDPWAWHNVSLCYLHLNDLKNAERCNEIALVLMDFGAARQVQQMIQQRKTGSFFSRLKHLFSG
ncbi:MAG: hypothetical protein RLP44_04630 [Aggregatilineales bacterium]